jgi:hypothetical protein
MCREIRNGPHIAKAVMNKGPKRAIPISFCSSQIAKAISMGLDHTLCIDIIAAHIRSTSEDIRVTAADSSRLVTDKSRVCA